MVFTFYSVNCSNRFKDSKYYVFSIKFNYNNYFQKLKLKFVEYLPSTDTDANLQTYSRQKKNRQPIETKMERDQIDKSTKVEADDRKYQFLMAISVKSIKDKFVHAPVCLHNRNYYQLDSPDTMERSGLSSDAQ